MSDVDFLFDSNQTQILEKDLDELDKKDLLRIDIDESLEAAINEMNSLKEEFSRTEAGNLIELCKENVMSTIVGQFGIASLLVETKDGGNVTTIHNAKQGIYSNDYDEYNRVAYEKGSYMPPHDNSKNGTWSGNSEGKTFSGSGKTSVGATFTKNQLDSSGNLTDAYTGKVVKGSETSPDHIYSLSEFHKNGGYMLSDQEKCDFGTDTANLASTDRSINQSLRDKDKMDWMDEKSAGRDVTNEEHFDIDRSRVEENAKRGQAAAKKHLPANKQKVEYYTKELVKSGLKDGANMAAFSAIGVIIHDFSLAVIEELKYILKNWGHKSLKELFHHFKMKISAVMDEIKSKWKSILAGSFEAGLIAFLSNILVFVINVFATTLKKLVGMIRAGFVSLCKAVKIMAFPPEGISRDEANFEAVKVLTAGIIGALSLGLSAAIEKGLQAIPGLQPIMMYPIPSMGKEPRTVSDIVSVTLSAVAGGLVTTVVLYFMDKSRESAKKDKLQIQMVATSGVIMQCKIAQSWCVLSDAYDFFAMTAKEEINSLKESYDKIHESQMNNKQSLAELLDIMKSF